MAVKIRTLNEILSHNYSGETQTKQQRDQLEEDARKLLLYTNASVSRNKKWEKETGITPSILESFREKTKSGKGPRFNDAKNEKFLLPKNASSKELLNLINNMRQYYEAQTSKKKGFEESMINRPKEQLAQLKQINKKDIKLDDIRDFWNKVHREKEKTKLSGNSYIENGTIYQGYKSEDIALTFANENVDEYMNNFKSDLEKSLSDENFSDSDIKKIVNNTLDNLVDDILNELNNEDIPKGNMKAKREKINEIIENKKDNYKKDELVKKVKNSLDNNNEVYNYGKKERHKESKKINPFSDL